MMQHVFTYEDIGRWLQNWLELDIRVKGFATSDGTYGGVLHLLLPRTGTRNLLPPGYLDYDTLFEIEAFDEQSITVVFYGVNGHDDMLNDWMIRYINHDQGCELMEPLPYGRIKIHANKIRLLRNIHMRSVAYTNEGLVVDFDDDPVLFEHLRILQMLLHAGYTQVRVLPDDMLYKGYWFSDDALDYTLKMTEHPADRRLWSSIEIPEWLELDGEIDEDFFPPSFPQEEITYQSDNIRVGIPFTLAEPEINEKSIERNCNRLRLELTGVLMSLLQYPHSQYTRKYE